MNYHTSHWHHLPRVAALFLSACCLLLLPVAVFSIWAAAQADVSPSEQRAFAVQWALLALWLLVTMIGSLCPLRGVVIVASVSNVFAFLTGLYYVSRVVRYGANLGDVLMSSVMISLPLGFATIQVLRRYARGYSKS